MKLNGNAFLASSLKSIKINPFDIIQSNLNTNPNRLQQIPKIFIYRKACPLINRGQADKSVLKQIRKDW